MSSLQVSYQEFMILPASNAIFRKIAYYCKFSVPGKSAIMLVGDGLRFGQRRTDVPKPLRSLPAVTAARFANAEKRISKLYQNRKNSMRKILNCFPSSRQLKKCKLFLTPDAKAGGSFYAARIYCSCFSKGVNTPRFLCNRLLL